MNPLTAHTVPLANDSTLSASRQSSVSPGEETAIGAARNIGQSLLEFIPTPSGKRIRGEPDISFPDQGQIKKGKPDEEKIGPPTPANRASHLQTKSQRQEPGYALSFSRRLSEDERRFPILNLQTATPAQRAESSRKITRYIGDELHHQWSNGRKKVEERTFMEHQLKLAADLDPNNEEVALLLEDIRGFHELIPARELLKQGGLKRRSNHG